MVGHDAHFTDAYQKCRNLLLSDECEANAMPGLEINADQVKCSHGATSGPITDEELFYLKARGISDKIARQLVTFGFAPIRNAWLSRAARRGETVTARTGTETHEGRFETLDDSGALVLETARGRIAIPAAEVYF